MKEFDKIYLSWRKGSSSRRFLVGVIELPSDGLATFRYDRKKAEEAQREGFSPYTEFQNIDAVYSQNVLDIFAQRLTKSVRPDIQAFYDFWDIDAAKSNDKAYMLAHTQGLVTTDNFEFLADYNPVHGLKFLTDLAGLSHLALPADTLFANDELDFRHDTGNVYDDKAIVTLKSGREVGYIKQVHCHLFHKPGADALRLKVKATEKNGVIKRVFVTVSKETS